MSNAAQIRLLINDDVHVYYRKQDGMFSACGLDLVRLIQDCGTAANLLKTIGENDLTDERRFKAMEDIHNASWEHAYIILVEGKGVRMFYNGCPVALKEAQKFL